MGESLAEFQTRERIKIASLKHRGNLAAIVKETGLNAEYVSKILFKLRRDKDLATNFLIANNIMQVIYDGYQQRMIYYEEMLRSLENEQQFQVSNCCRALIRIENSQNICFTCSKPCVPSTVTKIEIYDLKMKILSEVQKEDSAMISYAVKMGFTQAPPPAPTIKQDILVVNGGQQQGIQSRDGKSVIEVSSSEVLTYEQIKNMPPQEREKLKKDLQKTILGLALEQDTQPQEVKQ